MSLPKIAEMEDLTEGIAPNGATLVPLEQLQERLTEAKLRREIAFTESHTALFGSFVDPIDRLIDPESGQLWHPVGVGGVRKRNTQGGVYDFAFHTQYDYDISLSLSRQLALRNEFAINIIENRKSYVVGDGLHYSVAARPGQEITEKEKMTAQDVIDQFIEAEEWQELEQELVERRDRDGEFFLRSFFLPEEPYLAVRTIEPEEVRSPNGKDGPAENPQFGVEHVPGDQQTPVQYWVNDEPVPAHEIEHVKANVDRSVTRGIPSFFAVHKNLKRAEKLLRNMSAVATIQASIAYVRKYTNASKSAVKKFVDDKSDVRIVGPAGKERRYERHQPRVLHVPRGQDFESPIHAIDASKYVMVLQAELRAIAARFQMPEFMLTSDASNANFASTMVSEGPAVKAFKRLQGIFTRFGCRIMKRVIGSAIVAGVLPADFLERAKVVGEAPTVASRDTLKENQAKRIKNEAGVMSKKTWQQTEGLDPETEEKNLEAEREAFGGFDPNANPVPTDDEDDDA